MFPRRSIEASFGQIESIKNNLFELNSEIDMLMNGRVGMHIKETAFCWNDVSVRKYLAKEESLLATMNKEAQIVTDFLNQLDKDSKQLYDVEMYNGGLGASRRF